ncbi:MULTISPECIES: CAP domain-containing protein [unclassified Streptomyces]|uniref:CAP domain-containing protein n=1 Tax=unclassified Streptomyces TaxID=2593676 RepID=UPI00093996B6|nr:CAP domain-containing protein [Streptomyces sp. CB01580]OKJ37692.1 SCP-like extracellular [Streptomyces sp. CB01580]
MGRHRRSAATPVVQDRTTGDPDRHRSAHRGKRRGAPVRTGLIGVSAALAVGAVAVASGLLPGGDTDTVGGAPSDRVRTEGTSDPLGRGGSPTDRSDPAVGRGAGRTAAPEAQSPTASPSSASPSAPSLAPKTSAPAGRTDPSRSPGPAGSGRGSAPSEAGRSSAATRPPASSAPSAPSARRSKAASPAADSARSGVLALVNEERAKAGCSPVTASASLTSLAQDFSEDMAARGFFDHTDPGGRSPWDRASDAGVRGLAAENIARGQADARAVMNAWMHSEGHRRNILNCDYKTLGVGVHRGPGGPWWTQEFGF